MKAFVIVLGLIILPSASLAVDAFVQDGEPAAGLEGAPVLTTQMVEQEIKANGEQSALNKFFQCDNDYAYAQIVTAKPKWIEIAERLLQESDSCMTERLQSALGYAMAVKPKNVLPLVNKNEVLTADAICLPFISSETPKSKNLATIDKLVKALEKVDDAELQNQKAACLAEAEKIRGKLGE